MKAWRKNNQEASAKVKAVTQKLNYYRQYAIKDHPEIPILEQKLKAAKFQHLTRHQRRTHFAAEVAQPSYLLLALFKRVGLWTQP